jgi:hypothetical protein
MLTDADRLICTNLRMCLFLCIYSMYVGVCIYVCDSPVVKQQGRETKNSPPSSTELKNDGYIHELPHISSRIGA